MKIFPKRVLTLLTLTALTVGSALSTTTPFTLTLEAEENPVKAGAEIKIGITLRNSSSRAMYMSLGLSELDYTFDVRNDQNGIPAETDLARKSKARPYLSSDQVFYIQPGESLPKSSLVVSKFYDLSRPGKYTIQVSRAVPKELGGGTIKSNTITITVVQ